MVLASHVRMSQKLVEQLGAEGAVRYLERIAPAVAARIVFDMGEVFFQGLPGIMAPAALVRSLFRVSDF